MNLLKLTNNYSEEVAMVNKDVAKVVELYFQGHSVHEAIGIIRFDLKARIKLERDLKELEERK